MHTHTHTHTSHTPHTHHTHTHTHTYTHTHTHTHHNTPQLNAKHTTPHTHHTHSITTQTYVEGSGCGDPTGLVQQHRRWRRKTKLWESSCAYTVSSEDTCIHNATHTHTHTRTFLLERFNTTQQPTHKQQHHVWRCCAQHHGFLNVFSLLFSHSKHTRCEACVFWWCGVLCGAWCVVCGVWCVWSVVYGVVCHCMECSVWCMCGVWCVWSVCTCV